MIHGLKLSMAKGTTRREILGQDDTHNVTQKVLADWKNSMNSLSAVLVANQSAWQAVLQSYTTAHTVGASIYAAFDSDARSCLKTLQDAATVALSPPSQPEPPFSAVQNLEVSKQEISTILSRIANAEVLHTKRFEATRDWTYYDRKTKAMVAQEEKSKKPVTQKDVERRKRNQKQLMDCAINLNSITTRLYSDLEYIDMERLAITDRAMAALLNLQKFYYESNVSREAVDKCNHIRLARRVVPRDEIPAWMPQTLQPANPNPNMSNPNVMQLTPVPPIPPLAKQQHISHQIPQQQQPHPPASYTQAPHQQYGGHQYYDQPPMHHVVSAPSAPPPSGQTYAPPQYNLPPSAQPPSPIHPPSNGSPAIVG